MFDSPTEATAALAEYFDQSRLELVVEALVPAIIFHPRGEVVPGMTKFGGTPDVPEGFNWPRPALPVDPEEIASRGNHDAAAAMRNHIERNLPYAFVAQVNLAEAREAAPEATGLPGEGRLLFFYDFTVGPWDTGSRAAKVIWDQSPSETLGSLAMPEDLIEAVQHEQKAFAAFAEEGDVAFGGTNYGAAPRAMTMKPTWRLPHPHAVEFDRLLDFAKAATSKGGDPTIHDVFSAYEEALEAFGGSYLEEAWQRHQLLGSPIPEQSDPRHDAVVVTKFDKQHLSSDEWKTNREEIFREAKDWVLLLQLDVGDWMQAPYAEGMVYFVVHRGQLEQRNFDDVIAVYQQT